MFLHFTYHTCKAIICNKPQETNYFDMCSKQGKNATLKAAFSKVTSCQQKSPCLI